MPRLAVAALALLITLPAHGSSPLLERGSSDPELVVGSPRGRRSGCRRGRKIVGAIFSGASPMLGASALLAYLDAKKEPDPWAAASSQMSSGILVVASLGTGALGSGLRMSCEEGTVASWPTWAWAFAPAATGMLAGLYAPRERREGLIIGAVGVSIGWWELLAFTELGHHHVRAEPPPEGLSLRPSVGAVRTRSGWTPTLLLAGAF